jgi:hypothetical protein
MAPSFKRLRGVDGRQQGRSKIEANSADVRRSKPVS